MANSNATSGPLRCFCCLSRCASFPGLGGITVSSAHRCCAETWAWSFGCPMGRERLSTLLRTWVIVVPPVYKPARSRAGSAAWRGRLRSSEAPGGPAVDSAESGGVPEPDCAQNDGLVVPPRRLFRTHDCQRVPRNPRLYRSPRTASRGPADRRFVRRKLWIGRCFSLRPFRFAPFSAAFTIASDKSFRAIRSSRVEPLSGTFAACLEGD